MIEKTKICIFYDGYSFKLVSDFYKFGHPLRKRIDFTGLDAYIQNKTAEAIGIKEKDCAIVGRHLYLGVLPARELTPEQAKKHSDFCELLKRHNITGHFRDLQTDEEGNKVEKMVDADLMLDAFEMAVEKEIDVPILITRDKDYVPLLEKLNKRAVESVLFWWDIPEYTIGDRKRKPQRTAEILIRTATHHFEMTGIADKRKKTKLEEDIFYKGAEFSGTVNPPEQQPFQRNAPPQSKMQVPYEIRDTPIVDSIDNLLMNIEPRELTMEELGKTWVSTIVSLSQNGYGGYIKGPVGFIDRTMNNFQFSERDILETGFQIGIGMRVQFRLKFDPYRSEKFGKPLYRAYNIVLCDTPSALPAQPKAVPETGVAEGSVEDKPKAELLEPKIDTPPALPAQPAQLSEPKVNYGSGWSRAALIKPAFNASSNLKLSDARKIVVIKKKPAPLM